MTAAPPSRSTSCLILTRGDHVLLVRRARTGYADGQWNLPSGKLEHDEDAVTAVLREAAEETSLRPTPDEVRPVTVVHHRNTEGRARIGLVFAATQHEKPHGEPVNPNRTSAPRSAGSPATCCRPTRTRTTAAVAAWRAGEPLRLSGWTTTAAH